VLGELGSHMIDFAFWMAGDIESITAELATFQDRLDIDGLRRLTSNDVATMLLRFKDGSRGHVFLSAIAPLGPETQEQYVAVYGEHGFIEVVFPRSKGPSLTVALDGAEPHCTEVPDDVSPGSDLYDARLLKAWSNWCVADRLFVDAILNDFPATPSFWDGVKVQTVLDAALESHKRRTWVALGEF